MPEREAYYQASRALPDAASCEAMARAFDDAEQRVPKREWAALKAMLEKKDASYRS